MPLDREQYDRFLASKHLVANPTGFAIEPARLNAFLKDWQRAVVLWWLRLGRAGGFEDCGLGKTLQQLAFEEAIIQSGHGRRGLILTPPAVARQTLAEAEKFGISVDVRIVRDQSQIDSGINITNYERLHLFDAKSFDVVCLDEGSILKSYMGKTKQVLLREFRDTTYKLICTATPAPNDHMELGNHAEFLGVMRSNEMLARWFINDTMHAGEYRLKGHAETEFWRWLASWAVSVSKPSDLGDCYSDEGYILPPLNLQEHVFDGEFLQGTDPHKTLSATEIHKHKRATAAARAAEVFRLVNELPDEPWAIWCDTDYEADELIEAIPDAVEVRGSHKLEQKEEALEAFSLGQVKRLITKPEIAGFGLNWQHCANTAFIGLSHSYERWYQAICRFLRFGQLRTVNCHVVSAGAEQSITATVQEKGKKHETMKREMARHMRDWQSANVGGHRPLVELPEPIRYCDQAGNDWTLYHGDCVAVCRTLPDDSIDFCIHSPPFSNLYIYSDSLADMGNSRDDAEFFQHYEYLIGELHRITVPGRLCAVHCKDLPLYRGRDGAAGLQDFPGKIVAAFERAGWTYHSRVTIWKCPVTEMQRTKNHGLLHKQLCKDSAASRQGMADYLVVFRKWTEDGEFPRPVTIGSRYCRFTEYVGEEGPECEPATERQIAELSAPDQYSIQVWQRYASPVWFDINQMRVLNYKLGRDEKDEKHICPLQLDVIDRAIHLWTNPGDLVLDPFNGIGSSGYVTLKAGRRYIGCELKDSYVRQSLENFELAIAERDKPEPQILLPGFDEVIQESEAIAV